ncbi:MAG TPA: NRDE family protein [Rhodanobacteraceae bacterium]|jgi:uncharacterized protein with NRDE domain|nr:NRDE family protein [Rhodanobacteraceae bacterium]
MCVIAFAWKVHPRWRLLLIGNRDEAHARPSAPLRRWPEDAALLAGRDLEAGGTWMGVHAVGRACVVTNVRDPHAAQDRTSRGWLVTDYLRGADGAAQHAAALGRNAARYRPFNLLLFDATAAHFVSNDPDVRARNIDAGVHGLSNGDLDAPWPKVQRVTAALRAWLAADVDGFEPLFHAFADTSAARDDVLPDTGVGLELERQLSPVFVCGERYGTRATTLIALDHAGGGLIEERRFGPNGVPLGQTALRF